MKPYAVGVALFLGWGSSLIAEDESGSFQHFFGKDPVRAAIVGAGYEWGDWPRQPGESNQGCEEVGHSLWIKPNWGSWRRLWYVNTYNRGQYASKNGHRLVEWKGNVIRSEPVSGWMHGEYYDYRDEESVSDFSVAVIVYGFQVVCQAKITGKADVGMNYGDSKIGAGVRVGSYSSLYAAFTGAAVIPWNPDYSLVIQIDQKGRLMHDYFSGTMQSSFRAKSTYNNDSFNGYGYLTDILDPLRYEITRTCFWKRRRTGTQYGSSWNSTMSWVRERKWRYEKQWGVWAQPVSERQGYED